MFFLCGHMRKRKYGKAQSADSLSALLAAGWKLDKLTTRRGRSICVRNAPSSGCKSKSRSTNLNGTRLKPTPSPTALLTAMIATAELRPNNCTSGAADRSPGRLFAGHEVIYFYISCANSRSATKCHSMFRYVLFFSSIPTLSGRGREDCR